MIRTSAVFAALLVAVTCQPQVPQQQQQPLQFSVVQNSGPTGPAGFMPMNGNGGEEIRRTSSEAAAPETSSVQSRDYSGGGSEFYGYNYPAASYGVPSSSYGSSPDVSFGEPSAQGEASYSSPGYSSYYPGWGADDSKKRKPSYATPYYPPTTVSCPTPFTSNILTDLLKTGGTAKFGLVKSVVAAIATLFLAKIPILLAVKALMLKLFVVPLAVVVLSLPVLIPAALLLQPLWKRWKEFIGFDSSKPQMVMMMPSADDSSKPANSTQATPAATRALENNLESVLSNLLESERCMERLACQLGVRDAKSDYKQQVSWVLKFLQTLRVVQNNEPIRDKLKQYRDAYNYGTETGLGIVDDENVVNSVCSEMRYPCRSTQKSLQRSTRALVDLADF